MNAKKPQQSRFRGAAPAQPNYDDELTAEQVEALRKLADPDGSRARKRVLLYPAVV